MFRGKHLKPNTKDNTTFDPPENPMAFQGVFSIPAIHAFTTNLSGLFTTPERHAGRSLRNCLHPEPPLPKGGLKASCDDVTEPMSRLSKILLHQCFF